MAQCTVGTGKRGAISVLRYKKINLNLADVWLCTLALFRCVYLELEGRMVETWEIPNCKAWSWICYNWKSGLCSKVGIEKKTFIHSCSWIRTQLEISCAISSMSPRRVMGSWRSWLLTRRWVSERTAITFRACSIGPTFFLWQLEVLSCCVGARKKKQFWDSGDLLSTTMLFS